ncbi:hypothetical protein P8936_09420 [Edaphobacter paludis]|uniref:Alpha galactosidase C-terminal beta sandwich domain-containing protein n=1 Tax=Edaphobacter paludis TaxID=3035702 RepID=A0AAU7D3R9_9BACT
MRTTFNLPIRTIAFAACAISSVCAKGQSSETDPPKLQRIWTVDERFQSSNVEMRPNFWAAVLWRWLMGTTVLQPGTSPSPDLYHHPHCLRGVSGGVALLVINASSRHQAMDISKASKRYTLSAQQLNSRSAQLNGRVLELQPDDALPAMNGAKAPSGRMTLNAQSITFLAIPEAGNEARSQ